MSVDQIKAQLMTIFAVKGDSSSSSMFMLIGGMIMLSIFDYLAKAMPMIIVFISEIIKKRSKKYIKIPTMTLNTITSRIVFERHYANRSGDNLADAVLDYICRQDSAIELIYNEFYMASNEDSFIITPEIKVKIINKLFDDNKIKSIIFEVYSETLSLFQLKKWVTNVNMAYEAEKKNKFGEKRFYFDEHLIPKHSKNMPSMPHMIFSMTEFQTNKSLNNTYGEHIQAVRDRVNLFINQPQWYEQKGIPHTLGLLLHGPPGTGKTSMIKALAKDTKRHIFNIKLSKNTTQAQLNGLFYSETVNLRCDNNSGMGGSVTIPLNHRIYVMEDIDCLGDIVLDRKLLETKEVKEVKDLNIDISAEEPSTSNPSSGPHSGWNSQCNRSLLTATQKATIMMNNRDYDEAAEPPSELTLSFLLNLLDGVLETPGRILIMTTNHPDKLDPALVRPGRVDINLELGYCDNKLVKDMFNGFFKEEREFDNIQAKQLTPAKIQEILCNYFNNPDLAYSKLQDLQSQSQEDLLSIT
jgi:hypothetical protein